MLHGDSAAGEAYDRDMPPTGGLGAFGAAIFPLMMLAMLLRDRGPVKLFLQHGAISPETARKPATVAVKHRDLLHGPVRRGVLVATGDGRYWVDQQALRRLRRRVIIGCSLVTAVLVILGTVLLVRS